MQFNLLSPQALLIQTMCIYFKADAEYFLLRFHRRCDRGQEKRDSNLRVSKYRKSGREQARLLPIRCKTPPDIFVRSRRGKAKSLFARAYSTWHPREMHSLAVSSRSYAIITLIESSSAAALDYVTVTLDGATLTFNLPYHPRVENSPLFSDFSLGRLYFKKKKKENNDNRKQHGKITGLRNY